MVTVVHLNMADYKYYKYLEKDHGKVIRLIIIIIIIMYCIWRFKQSLTANYNNNNITWQQD